MNLRQGIHYFRTLFPPGPPDLSGPLALKLNFLNHPLMNVLIRSSSKLNRQIIGLLDLQEDKAYSFDLQTYIYYIYV